MFKSKGKICNAGYNACFVSSNGTVRPCQGIDEIMGSIFNKIKFKKELIRCPRENCRCPLSCDSYLFEKALIECGIK
jgi:MoaA/NifB/PqqE/SkfB family radical SAM enzyme